VTGRALITGATGKTGRRLLALLDQRSTPAKAASRQPPAGGVHFDWSDRTTWDAALDETSSIYLVAPMGTSDAVPLMIEFIETAVSRGVVRFVLLSASSLDAGGPAMGQVHQWLLASDAEWVVLRPSWFMENFSEGPHCATIREERAIYSATGHGRVPFISTLDIARAAVTALTAVIAPHADYVLTGPELLSYDDVATRISGVIGETITHYSLTFDELVARHIRNGLTEPHAQTLAFMDLIIADGAEDRITTGLAQLVAEPPVTFDQFVTQNASLWVQP
jgi:ergot alkaloid biosynthesis protein